MQRNQNEETINSETQLKDIIEILGRLYKYNQLYFCVKKKNKKNLLTNNVKKKDYIYI